MHVRYVVVHREDVFRVGLVRKDVDHPGEHVGMEDSSFRFAGFLGVDGTEHAELGMGRLVVSAILPVR